MRQKECMDVPPSPVMPGLYVDNDYPHQLSPLYVAFKAGSPQN